MDVKDLRSLIKIITDTDITEFEMENSGQRIVIRRGHFGGAAPALDKMPAHSVTMPTVQQSSLSLAQEEITPIEETSPEAAVTSGGEKIKSPIVGTFYRAPSPDSPPYVEVGDVVEKGQTLCIVEAMKLMNEIEAEFKCRIVEILKENAQPVEFGDVLFIVERL